MHQPRTVSRLVNRNVLSPTGRTSMRLEPELWSALEEMCHRENLTLADMITKIDEQRTKHRNEDVWEVRTSAVRVAILAYYRDAATNEGHALVGHGELNAVVA